MLTDIVRGQSCSVTKRPGLQTVNTNNTTITSGKGVIGQFDYRSVSGGVFTRRHVWYLDNGHIGTITSDPGGSGAFTDIGAAAGTVIPEFALAKNLLFGVSTTGFKLRGTALEGFGITRPASAPTLSDGGAGAMTGTFEVRVTFLNGNTAQESSAGNTSTALPLAGRQLTIASIPVSADAQVTARKIYIRDNTSQTEFRFATTINDNVTTSTTINLSVGTLILTGPSTTSNDPPPSGFKHLAWVNSRMFVADDSLLYWSAKNKPEAFDSTFAGEPIGAEDGQKIIGLVGYGDDLLIFKTQSVYILSGVSPDSWRIRSLFTSIGAISQQSIKEVNGTLYWWSHRGPMRWSGTGDPEPIGEILLGKRLAWSKTWQSLIQCAIDTTNKLVLWTFPDGNNLASRNNLILPFSYECDAFVASRWDPFDVASLCNVQDSNGVEYVYAGNYNGQIFRFSTSYLDDGIVGGTTTGTVVGSGTITTVTGLGFYNTSEGLKERYLVFEYADGPLAGQFYARTQITSNTGTQLTFNAVGLTAGVNYNFYIGGPNFEWDTVDHDSGVPFSKKRYEFLYVAVGLLNATLGIDVITSESTPLAKRSFSFNATGGSSQGWPLSFRVGATGITWRLRVRNRATGATLRLDEAQMESELLTGKLG